jgi:cytidylate kinase
MGIITISRFTMSGGTRLAECLCERLGIPSVSREVIAQVADGFGTSENVLWERLEAATWHSPERHLYLAALQLALAERARQGPFVYHGLAGHFLLKGIPRVLKVGILAPLKSRAEALMKQKNINMNEAVKSIQRWDERRSRWVRYLYHVDWLDPALYDLMINMANISEESACALIMFELGREEFKDLPEHKRTIDDFVTASRIKTALAAHERTKGLELEVTVRENVAKIAGSVPMTSIAYLGGKKSTRDDIIKVARSLPDVHRVEVNLEGTTVAFE